VAIGVFAALVGGCGSSSHRTALVARSPQVVSGTCSSTAGTSGPVKQSCVMVLSDGRRFSCPPAVARSRPSVAELEHTRVCARLSSLVLSPGTRAVIDAIRRTQACLARQGIRALGGPVLPPNRSSSNSADGVLALSHAGSPAFIAFYTDPARATRRVSHGTQGTSATRSSGEVRSQSSGVTRRSVSVARSKPVRRADRAPAIA